MLTPKTPKFKKYSDNDKILAKTPRVVRKRIAKGKFMSLIIYVQTNIY